MRLLTGILVLILLLPTLAFPEITSAEREKTYKQLEVFANVLSMLQNAYVEEIDSDEVMNGAIRGLLYNLDPHSSYLTPEDLKELQDETKGQFSGIGIEVTVKDGLLTIISPIEGTPAAKAKLQAKDIIISIDGKKTKKMGPMEAMKKLRGEKGTEVTISISRQSWNEPKEFTLIRDIIPLNSVNAFFILPGIVYSRITNFQAQTDRQYRKKINDLKEKEPMQGVILDLRNNPGGLLDQAVKITNLFLNNGTIVSIQGRTSEQNTLFQANPKTLFADIPVIVLINEGSASASEIVSGALQAHKRALVLGTQSFGKGSVQSVIPLPDGAGLRITTARYFTPKGISIQALGITPDIIVPFIPYHEKTEKATTHQTREVDLPNHFLAAPLKTTEQNDTPEPESAKRLREDNQLREACNIMKGLIFYSHPMISH